MISDRSWLMSAEKAKVSTSAAILDVFCLRGDARAVHRSGAAIGVWIV